MNDKKKKIILDDSDPADLILDHFAVQMDFEDDEDEELLRENTEAWIDKYVTPESQKDIEPNRKQMVDEWIKYVKESAADPNKRFDTGLGTNKMNK